jgi:hypothetical protein
MNCNGIEEVPVTKNLGNKGEQMSHSPELVDRQAETLHYEANINRVHNVRVTGRERKTPVTRTSDFLW